MLDSLLNHVKSIVQITLRRSTFLRIAQAITLAGLIGLIAACGDPKFRTPAIAVTFSTAFPPPTAVSTGASAGIAAVVANDSANAGVSWACSPAGECGSFAPNLSGSNIPTTYQAPSTIPAGGSVTITATSVTDNTKSIATTVTID
jgi:hypothetical protein